MLAQTIDARVLGETGLDTDVLRLKDYGVAFGGEEHFVRFCSDDREGEGLGGVLEFDFMRLGRLPRWAGDNRVGDFIAFHGRVGDLDVNSSVWPRDRQYMRVSSAGGRIVPVSYATSSFNCWMSVPNTLQALPARERSAVKVDPEFLTFVALYPGQASRVAGSTQTAAAAPRSPKRVRGFDKTAMGERRRWKGWGAKLRCISRRIYIVPLGIALLVSSVGFHRPSPMTPRILHPEAMQI